MRTIFIKLNKLKGRHKAVEFKNFTFSIMIKVKRAKNVKVFCKNKTKA